MCQSPEWRSPSQSEAFRNVFCKYPDGHYSTAALHNIEMHWSQCTHWVGYGGSFGVWRVSLGASHSLNMCSCLLCSSSSSTLSYSSFMSPSSSSSTSSHDSSKCLLTSPSAVSRGSPGRIHSPTNQRPPCQLARKWDIRGPGKTLENKNFYLDTNSSKCSCCSSLQKESSSLQ